MIQRRCPFISWDVIVSYDSIKGRTIHAYKLIDGQQRMITISLILCVLRDLINEKTQIV